MLTLNDGRSELWQWDTGRTLAVDADCSQVHFSNKVFGRSIDVDVTDGVAIIPDILLQTDKDLNVWAFVGTAENGYTKISKIFTVNRRNKPADYVFTPVDQNTLDDLQIQIGDLDDLTTEAKDTLVAAINEAAASGGGSSDAVLYTPQTLTDAQKKQARENIDAASSDFVINGTLNDDDALTVDKTYAQIQEAVQGGKRVTLKVNKYTIDISLPLIGENDTGYVFEASLTIFPTVSLLFFASVSASRNSWNTDQLIVADSSGNLVQISMDRDPEQPMEIATKQYVDTNATGGTDMGITGATVGQIAKIAAVDASGVPTAWSPVDMPTGGSGGETWELLSDTTIDEDVSAISMAIPPCKKIKAYFEGHQVFSDGSETPNKFTTLTPRFKVDGRQNLQPFYTLNEASRFNSDVVSVITFDVSSPPFATGELFRIFPDGQNSATNHNIVTNEIAITAASAITEIKIDPKYNFVSGVGNIVRFASGGRFRIYGVKA